ncbi:hypothetical protein A5747_06205 [Mycobacterium sp. IS-836]|nr:hypothetical protein A5747_06205 [Mycobacterium sp. IS-836]
MNIWVFTLVGWTELTRMKCWPSSAAKVRIKPTTPVFGGDVVTGVRVGLEPADRACQDDTFLLCGLTELHVEFAQAD